MENEQTGSSFAHDGEFFALLSIDNRLRIWETSSGKLVQEFSPSSNQQNTCTCLCWTRKHDTAAGRERTSKRKLSGSILTKRGTFSSIVLGTKSGKLLLYNTGIAEAESGSYDGGHFEKVNCVIFNRHKDTLLSCSSDKHIIEWSYSKKEIVSKWQGDKISVNMICLGPGGDTLLSAGMSIKLWSLHSKELLMKFNGHTSAVKLLQFSDFRSKIPSEENDNGYYFISGSKNDRVINAWHINYLKPEKSPVAAFLLTDPPVFMNSAVIEKKEKPLQLVVGCQDGKILYFTSTLNGKTNRPIEHSKILEVVEADENDNLKKPQAFFNSRLIINEDVSLQMVSGSYIHPLFKIHNLTTMNMYSKVIQYVPANTQLKNKDRRQLKQTIENVIQDSPHVVREQFTVPTSLVNFSSNENMSEVIVNNAPKDGEITTIISENQERVKDRESASAATFSMMITQNLQACNFQEVINILLEKKHTAYVALKTVERTPIKHISKLLEILVEQLYLEPQKCQPLGIWIKAVFSARLADLTSLKDPTFQATLQKLFDLLKDQADIYTKLIKLQGKMDLLISYVDNQNRGSQFEDQTTSIIYNDESDDEDMSLFDEMEDDVMVSSESNGESGESEESEIDDTDDDDEK